MSEQKLEEMVKILNEILRWLRFQNLPNLKKLLSETLKTTADFKIYELSDGIKSSREIAKLVGLSDHHGVLEKWKRWNKIGIVESATIEGRYKHICSLEEVDLEIPSEETQKKAKEDDEVVAR